MARTEDEDQVPVHCDQCGSTFVIGLREASTTSGLVYCSTRCEDAAGGGR